MAPVAEADKTDLGDLTLTPEEQATEAAEAAGARERDLGASEEGVREVYDRTYKETLAGLESGEGASLGAEVDVDLEREENESEEAFARRVQAEAERAEALADTGTAEQSQIPGSPRKEGGEPDMVIPPDQILVRHEPAAGARQKTAGITILNVKGVKVQVEGGFRRGERIKFSGEAVIVKEETTDKLDKSTRSVAEAVQTFAATVLDFELAGEDGEE